MTISPATTSVGFIGLGIMGRSMAGHIRAAGYSLHVHTRTRSTAEALLTQGAHWHDTPAGVAGAADVVITMVGYPSDVEEIYFGPRGLIECARPGALLIDMTTSSPTLAVRIAEAAAARGLAALDAPVSGGDVGAREAKLSIMVGGDGAAFDRARPLFERMGTNIVRQGGPGAGQHTKMCNQVVIASNIMAVCEGLIYAKRAGLDAKTVLSSIGAGAAGGFQLNVLGARIVNGDFQPGFYVRHFLKDMSIALAECERMQLKLPGLELAKALFDKLSAEGGDNLGTQGLYMLYDR